GERKGISIATCHQGEPACALLSGDRGCEKVVCFEPWGFGVCKSKGDDKFRQDIQLLNHVIVELAPALRGGKQLAALRRRVQAVPSNNNGARPLIAVEPQQKIGEADNGASRLAVAAANGFWQRVVRSMGEGVAVDDEQRTPRRVGLTHC